MIVCFVCAFACVCCLVVCVLVFVYVFVYLFVCRVMVCLFVWIGLMLFARVRFIVCLFRSPFVCWFAILFGGMFVFAWMCLNVCLCVCWLFGLVRFDLI